MHWRSTFLVKLLKHSTTPVFLWILRMFSEWLFHRIPVSDCLWLWYCLIQSKSASVFKPALRCPHAEKFDQDLVPNLFRTFSNKSVFVILGNHFILLYIQEAVAQKCSLKKVFLKVLQNPQKNTCARVSFLIKLHASGLQQFYKRDSGRSVFLWICENF